MRQENNDLYININREFAIHYRKELGRLLRF